ncbi:MAG: PLP-dependent transferase [Planctomycetes bacterium]|nr:PLP-dependent transferase [Planctomycetota bacterium]
MNQPRRPGLETICVHHAEDREAQRGAAAPPLYQCSIFTYPDCESFVNRKAPGDGRYDYTRVANPTTALLESKVAELERGEACRAFASGMAAISAGILSCVKSGGHIITVETVYGPTRRFLSDYLPKFNIETTYIRGTDIEQFQAALRPNTQLIHLESPSSFFFEVQDMPAVVALAKSKGIAVSIDNSNASPMFQNPLDHGVDLVMHTASKYIGGHSDLVGGLVVASRERIEKLVSLEGELLGGIADPFASWLMLRGLRTLGVRMDRHYKSALTIARLLEMDSRVARVWYTGLDSHAQARLAKKQMRGHGCLVSFQLQNPTRERTFAVVEALKLFGIAVSWGGFESLAIPIETPDPATGKPTWIIRLSIGLETVEDLKADLYQALDV